MNVQQVKYFFRSAINSGQEKKCPFCGSNDLQSIDSKYIVTYLLQCKSCGLNHRHPRDNQKRLDKFYQEEYDIDTHMMTKLPSDGEIKKLKETNFPDLRNTSLYIRSLSEKHSNVLDYGCSWGYNVFKLNQLGLKTQGFELSKPRARFGAEKLDVTIHSDVKKIPLGLDVVMSSHVIEHLTDIQGFINLSKRVLTDEGYFMAFCPNGSEDYRKRDEHVWHVNWGDVHPNHLSVEFAKSAFKKHPYLILTGDWKFDLDTIKNWNGKDQIVGTKRDGFELLIIARPNILV